MKVYYVIGKAWPFNYPFGYFSTQQAAQGSVDMSPDYKDKLEVKELELSEVSIEFKRDR